MNGSHSQNTPSGAPDRRHQLIARVHERRVEIDAFLDRARPRGSRLGAISIISSALAAALTAGPALGGDAFSGSVSDGLGLAKESLVWQVLCLAALLMSLIAAICTNLLRAADTTTRIGTAEAVNAELKGLQTMLEFGDLDLEAALKLYQQCVAQTPFIDENLASLPSR